MLTTITINTDIWKTPGEFAKLNRITPQAVTNRIARKKLQKVLIEELNLILVAPLNTPGPEIKKD